MRRAAVVLAVTTLLGVGSDAAFAQTSATTEWTGTGRSTFGVEALAWWFKASPVPVPVVTDGIVGWPDTKTLLGGQDLDTGANPGFRIGGRYELDARTGLEANFFYFGSRSTSAGVSSSGEPGSTNLLVPYIDAPTGQESATAISLSPSYRGNAREELSNNLMGAEINGAWALAPAGGWKMDALAGFRYLRLRESYALTTQSPYNPAFGNDIWDTTDQFDTRNNFYGAQAGLRARYDNGAFFATVSGKVAIGAMVQSVNIGGALVTNDFNNFGATQTFAGGYFALPTNIGNASRTEFAVVPEVALNLGYQVTPAATIVFGYSFLYASSVVRPGNQMSRTINTTQSTAYTENPAATLQGVAQPAFKFNDSSFWAQGVNLGLMIRF